MPERQITQQIEWLNMQLSSSLSVIAEDLGLSVAQANILLLINDGVTKTGGIAQKLSVSDATISETIRLLKQKELVAATENPRDTRSKILSLTEDGRRMAEKLGSYKLVFHQAIADMHMSERSILAEALELLAQKIKASPYL